MNPELFYEKRVPQKSASFRDGVSILRQIEEEISCSLIRMSRSARSFIC